MDKIRPYFSFQGRVNRQRYWLTVVGLAVSYFATVLILAVLSRVPVIGLLFGFVLLVAVIAFIVAGLALATRRLHDRAKSAWWLLPMYVPMLFFTVLGEIASASSSEAGVGLLLLALPFTIWMIVELGCLKGTTGPNRFGEDPLQPSAVVFA